MLTILPVDSLDKAKLNYKRSKIKKTQILLCDTHRRFNDYIEMIKHRNNGKYEHIPHFIISKNGEIFQLFDVKHYSSIFNIPELDKRLITVAIENLGWLNKNSINGLLSNWIGDAYRSEPYIKNWRGYFFWDKYTDKQMDSVVVLCEYLCEEYNINKEIVSSQGFIGKAYDVHGILCKSNYSDMFTDINPSFSFSHFLRQPVEEVI